MAEITQKLGFDAKQAISTLDSLSNSLDRANKAMSNLKGASRGAQSLQRTEKRLNSTKKSAEDVTVSWQTMLRVLQTQIIVRGLNLAIDTLHDGIEAAREFGLAIEEIRTIDSAARSAEDLSKQILAVSNAIVKSPLDVAEGLYQTLSNQVVEAGEALQFTEQAAKLATLTASETGDAVNALSSVMNSYSLEASEASRVSDTLFKTVEQGRLRLSEIANVIGRVTPITAQLGISWEETAAAIATMTRTGVRADTAITQLRAVTTRLIKPTEDILALYRRWGVSDGREAIQTFGGLGGVLQKISEETQGNSQEMAELLRNVRAITGAFGIMTDEGRTLDSILNEIQNSTGATERAWDQFAQSDAARLTLATQEFSNQLTEIGQKLLPSIASWLEATNTYISGMAKAWDQVFGGIEASTKSVNTFEAVMESAREQAQRTSEELAQRNTFDALRNASNKYYAEANKQEQELARVRDLKIEQATAAYLDAGNDITEFYEDQLKTVEDFTDQATGRIQRNLERIADIRRDVSDQVLEYQLDNEEDAYSRLRILESEYQRRLQQRQEAAQNIGADPASLEEALDANRQLLDVARQRVRAAEEAEVGAYQIRQLQGDVTDILADQIPLIESFNRVQSSAVGAGEQQERVLAEIVARQKELDDTREAFAKSGNEITAAEQARLDVLEQGLSLLRQQEAEGAKVLEAFGLDLDREGVIRQLESALNEARKDWEAEVARAKAAFQDDIFPIRVALQLQEGGLRAQLAEQLGIEEIEGEPLDDLARRIDDAAANLGERNEAFQENLKDDADLLANGLATVNRTLDELETESRQVAENFALTPGFLLQVATNSEKARQSLAETVGPANQITARLREAAQLVAQGGSLQEGTLAALDAEISKQEQSKNLSAEQVRLAKAAVNELRVLGQTVRENNEISRELPEAEALDLVNQLNESQKQLTDQELTAEEAARNWAENQRQIEESLGRTRPSAEGTANSLDSASTSMGMVNTNAISSAASIGSAASNAAVLAANLERAAAARAAANAVGPAGPQTIQNPFQAAGGLVRGQDSNLASLADGESVVSAKNTRRFFSELNAMNQGKTPVVRERGNSVTNIGDVNVTVQGGDSSQQTVREIGHALRREIRRGNIRLN